MRRRSLTKAGCLLLLLGLALTAHAITGDEILDQMRDAFTLGDEGDGILVSIDVRNEYASGVSTEYRLAVVADTMFDEIETTYVLMYFLGGDDEGMMLLLHMPEGKQANTRMWLHIAAFGLTKELISDQDQAGRFAGSTFTYADIAGAREMREEYQARLLRDESVLVGDEERAVWVLELTPQENVSTEHARVLLWVDQETDQFLRLEGYDRHGALAKEIVVTALDTFEERRVPDTLVGRDLISGDVSEIRIHGMRRPEQALSLEIFDHQNLLSFDPEVYGF